jgi:hypothetical protein
VNRTMVAAMGACCVGWIATLTLALQPTWTIGAWISLVVSLVAWLTCLTLAFIALAR